jgi:hypothetical protein
MSEGQPEPEQQEEEREPEPWEAFLVQPSTVAEVWRAGRPKETLTEHYAKCFKREGEEQGDYNEHIIAEFQVYNLMFAKQILLDDTQSSYLLHVFYQLLGIDDRGDKVDCPQAQADLNAALEHKFSVFKDHLTTWARVGVFSAD